jgi:hypothetical protein
MEGHECGIERRKSRVDISRCSQAQYRCPRCQEASARGICDCGVCNTAVGIERFSPSLRRLVSSDTNHILQVHTIFSPNPQHPTPHHTHQSHQHHNDSLLSILHHAHTQKAKPHPPHCGRLWRPLAPILRQKDRTPNRGSHAAQTAFGVRALVVRGDEGGEILRRRDRSSRAPYARAYDGRACAGGAASQSCLDVRHLHRGLHHLLG